MSALPNLLWIDLETTGLSPTEYIPLEIAVVVTDADLNELEAVNWVMHWDIKLSEVSEFALRTHMQNGLLLDVATIGDDIDVVKQELSRLMLRSDLWPELLDKDTLPPLCGSSINFEREWLQEWFSEFYRDIHYRSIDVSSLKELMKRWEPESAISRRETSKHRALDDIRDSIAELKHYREVLGWGLDLDPSAH